MARDHYGDPARLGRAAALQLTRVGDIYFVTGGARSGKSAFAERLALKSKRTVVYVATMEPLDDELRDRVARHRAGRPDGWQTVEAPLDITAAIEGAPSDACVLLDCLSLWATNRLLESGNNLSREEASALERRLDAELDATLAAATDRDGLLILVSNEVGSGVVPPYPLGRVYRDLLGRANQRASRAADRAWLLVAGRALELPAPD